MEKREQQPWRRSKMPVRTGVSLRYSFIHIPYFIFTHTIYMFFDSCLCKFNLQLFLELH